MIKDIKIFGERNSGTIFLHQLLLQNLFNFGILSCKPEATGSGWKHGFPDVKRFSEKDREETLFIFIIRDLEPWLISMYNNPYHFEKPKTIEDFINNKLNVSSQALSFGDYAVEGEQLSSGQGRCVMSLRYAKIKSYLKFFGEAKNAMMVNLEDLQNGNSKFLYFLKNNYGLDMRLPHRPITRHTKAIQELHGKEFDSKEEFNEAYKAAETRHLRSKNRKYDTVLPENIVNSKRDEGLECLVNRLKKMYYYK